MNNKIKLIYIAILFTLVAVLSGCASPASKEAVVVHDIQIAKHHQSTVSVITQGGGETESIGIPNISNADLKAAIEESIVESGLFSQVIQGNGSDYILSVNIINMTKPMFGLSFTVRMEAAWSLVNKNTKQVAMRESITSSYTATVGQAFAAVKRLRLAVEGATRENIKSGLIKISRLRLN
jgi:hypothetical protein